MERIINSNLDTDLYKLTMGQAVLHNYPDLQVGYEFINRGKTVFPDQFDNKLQQQIEMMADVKLVPQEREFLETGCNGVFTPDFIDWYNGYRFNPDEVSINREGGLTVNIDGPWQRTIFWEVPLMAAISELYFDEIGHIPDLDWEKRCGDKAITFQKVKARVAEFGTRRRRSHQVQDRAIEIFKKHQDGWFLGTSNVYFALKHRLTAVGTFAHEWVTAHAGLFGPTLANQAALTVWAKEFQGKLATALTDTFTTDIFLNSLNQDLATTYQAFRQDSGSPERWTDKIAGHLQGLSINPMGKIAFYSDALNTKKVLEILDYTRGRMQEVFGIGTDITNDVGAEPLNIVIKLHHIIGPDGQQIGVCKFSDDPGKVSGDPFAIKDWANELGIRR